MLLLPLKSFLFLGKKKDREKKKKQKHCNQIKSKNEDEWWKCLTKPPLLLTENRLFCTTYKLFFLFSLSFKVTIQGNWSFWYWNFTGTGLELNKCSVGLKTSIPEIEKLKAQHPLPREDRNVCKATFVVDREQIVLHYLQTFFLFSLSLSKSQFMETEVSGTGTLL